MATTSYVTRSGRVAVRRQVSRLDTSGPPLRRVVAVERAWICGDVTVRLSCCRGSHFEDVQRIDLLTPPDSAAGWNARFPIGTWVVARLPGGDVFCSRTVTDAKELRDGRPVVALEGRSGFIACSLLEVVPPEVPCRMCAREGRC